MSGRFVKVYNQNLIDINDHLQLPAQLSTFFHEYGHAMYRRTAAEEIIDEESLTRTETAATLSSLRLPDQEGLPEIATVSVLMIREAAKFGGAHQKSSRISLLIRCGCEVCEQHPVVASSPPSIIKEGINGTFLNFFAGSA